MAGRDIFFDYPTGDDEAVSRSERRFLEDATVTDWSMLLNYCERRDVAPGEALTEIGQEGRELVVVLSGSFRVEVPSGRRGRMTRLGTIGDGEVFGEIAFLDGRPRSSRVIAEEPSEVAVLTWTSFERLSEVRPNLALRILSDLGAILARMVRRMEANNA